MLGEEKTAKGGSVFPCFPTEGGMCCAVLGPAAAPLLGLLPPSDVLEQSEKAGLGSEDAFLSVAPSQEDGA